MLWKRNWSSNSCFQHNNCNLIVTFHGMGKRYCNRDLVFLHAVHTRTAALKLYRHHEELHARTKMSTLLYSGSKYYIWKMFEWDRVLTEKIRSRTRRKDTQHKTSRHEQLGGSVCPTFMWCQQNPLITFVEFLHHIPATLTHGQSPITHVRKGNC